MGKKSKANKLAKMSEEERARYLQMRADIEEETRRRKMQLLSLYMKNKLKHEDAFCRLNMAKINQEWRSILRQTKCQELRHEIEEVERFFREALECKGQTISRLLKDLDVSEDMYATLQHSHMETVEKFIDVQNERVAYLKCIYEREKEAVLRECREDFEHYKELQDRAQKELECVFYQLEDQTNTSVQEKENKYLERIDDIQSTVQLRLDEITRNGEEKLENLWEEYQSVLSEYVGHTEGFYTEYMELKERDAANTSVMRDHCFEIARATDQLAHLKLVAADADENNQVKVGYLEKTRDQLSARLSKLKAQVDKELNTEADRFTLVSVEGHNALKYLQGIVQKGETLMQLATICRKMETDREKLAPLGLPPLARPMLEHDDKDMTKAPDALKKQCFGHWRLMENFWRRVNTATIDVLCLKQQKKALVVENAQLKKELQEYLLKLNLSHGSNAHINNYLAQRPRSMCVERVRQLEPQRKQAQSARVSFGRQTASYVEANFSSVVRSQQLGKGRMKLAKIATSVKC